MKILLVGSGGREHALALGLQADPECSELHVAPGNPGIAQIATTHPLVITDNSAIVALAQKIGAELVVIGPEVPLVNGVADELRRAGIATFGPSKVAAQLEGSKTFAKEVMSDAGVPTAKSFTCTTQSEIENALDSFGAVCAATTRNSLRFKCTAWPRRAMKHGASSAVIPGTIRYWKSAKSFQTTSLLTNR